MNDDAFGDLNPLTWEQQQPNPTGSSEENTEQFLDEDQPILIPTATQAPNPAASDSAPAVSAETPNLDTSQKYQKGEEVLYTNSTGTHRASILKVHLDDELVPFYDVLVDGREKQTDNAHLSRDPAPKSEPDPDTSISAPETTPPNWLGNNQDNTNLTAPDTSNNLGAANTMAAAPTPTWLDTNKTIYDDPFAELADTTANGAPSNSEPDLLDNSTAPNSTATASNTPNPFVNTDNPFEDPYAEISPAPSAEQPEILDNTTANITHPNPFAGVVAPSEVSNPFEDETIIANSASQDYASSEREEVSPPENIIAAAAMYQNPFPPQQSQAGPAQYLNPFGGSTVMSAPESNNSITSDLSDTEPTRSTDPNPFARQSYTAPPAVYANPFEAAQPRPSDPGPLTQSFSYPDAAMDTSSRSSMTSRPGPDLPSPYELLKSSLHQSSTEESPVVLHPNPFDISAQAAVAPVEDPQPTVHPTVESGAEDDNNPFQPVPFHPISEGKLLQRSSSSFDPLAPPINEAETTARSSLYDNPFEASQSSLLPEHEPLTAETQQDNPFFEVDANNETTNNNQDVSFLAPESTSALQEDPLLVPTAFSTGDESDGDWPAYDPIAYELGHDIEGETTPFAPTKSFINLAINSPNKDAAARQSLIRHDSNDSFNPNNTQPARPPGQSYYEDTGVMGVANNADSSFASSNASDKPPSSCSGRWRTAALLICPLLIAAAIAIPLVVLDPLGKSKPTNAPNSAPSIRPTTLRPIETAGPSPPLVSSSTLTPAINATESSPSPAPTTNGSVASQLMPTIMPSPVKTKEPAANHTNIFDHSENTEAPINNSTDTLPPTSDNASTAAPSDPNDISNATSSPQNDANNNTGSPTDEITFTPTEEPNFSRTTAPDGMPNATSEPENDTNNITSSPTTDATTLSPTEEDLSPNTTAPFGDSQNDAGALGNTSSPSATTLQPTEAPQELNGTFASVPPENATTTAPTEPNATIV